ncbi:hypothetical protein [Rhodococcus jostii]|uniref:hypothetical protein n=1 Tax=Rhodococcus jostii TaxID=132919 RepID=UPI00362DBC4B
MSATDDQSGCDSSAEGHHDGDENRTDTRTRFAEGQTDGKAQVLWLSRRQQLAMWLSLLVLALLTIGIYWFLSNRNDAAYDACVGSPNARWSCEQDLKDRWSTTWAFAVVIAPIVLAGWALVFWYLNEERRMASTVEVAFNDLVGVNSRDRENNGPDLRLATLWSENRGRLDIYHRLVTEYARSTRITTITTLAVGFILVIIIGLVGIFVSDTTGGAISSSVIAASGALLTGFIGKAVITNFANSSKELTAFFSHPIEVEKALNAERIIQEMPEDQRAPAQLLLIEYLTGGPRSSAEASTKSEN